MMPSDYLRILPASAYRASLATIRWMVWAAAGFLAAWVISGWFWAAIAPDAKEAAAFTPPPAEPVLAAQTVVARHLLGGESGNSTAGTPQFQLQGAMTASGKAPGFAILAENGKSPVVVVEGEVFASGIKLLQVLPRQVRLEIAGRTETIELRDTQGNPAPDGVTVVRPASKRTAQETNPISARKSPKP